MFYILAIEFKLEERKLPATKRKKEKLVNWPHSRYKRSILVSIIFT